MSNKLLRHLTLARSIPHSPYKLSAKQLQVKLAEQGIQVSLRTLQQDLEEMVSMALLMGWSPLVKQGCSCWEQWICCE